MELLGYMGLVEACFGPLGDSVNLDARELHGLPQTYHGLRKKFGHTQLYSYMMWVNWKLVSVQLEIVLIPTQDRCTVCSEHPIGWKSY
jgi:hypothetical protein